MLTVGNPEEEGLVLRAQAQQNFVKSSFFQVQYLVAAHRLPVGQLIHPGIANMRTRGSKIAYGFD